MAQLQQTSITGSISSTGSLIISGSEPVQLPLLNSGSGEIDLTTPYQLWFDSGDLNVKYHLKGSYNAGVWSAANPLINARNGLAGFGVQNSTAVFGGSEPSVSNKTEEYNGSSWSASGTMITARLNLMGMGKLDAGLAAGGRTPSIVSCGEEYNGSTWSAGGNLITARRTGGAAGTQNAGLVFGGSTPSIVSCTEEYNGTAWATGGVLSTGRQSMTGGGIQNSAAAFGGSTPTVSGATEHYNGSSWSTGGTMNIPRFSLTGVAECSYSALAYMGYASSADQTCTELYDGTSWTVGNTASGARRELSGTGTPFAALAAGGESPVVACTEEWTRPYEPPFTCFLPFSSWAAGGTMIVARSSLSGFGIQNAAQAAGGYVASTVTCHEGYNGSSWSTDTAVPAAKYGNAAYGTANAGVISGGVPGTTCTSEWDGSSWTAGGSINCSRGLLAGGGTQNSGVIFGGYPGELAFTEEYDGSSYSIANVMNSGRYALGGGGTQNAAVAFNGFINPTHQSLTEEYDGTSWSVGNTTINSKYAVAAGNIGCQDRILSVAGLNGPASFLNTTEEYNGTSWSAGNTYPISTGYFGGAGTQNAALAFGGYTPSVTGATYETTGEEVNLATYKCNLPSAWSAGGATIVAGYGARAGVQNSYSSMGPYNDQDAHENYNGTSWSTATNRTYSARSAAAAGVDADNTVSFAGYPALATTAEWNGSSWATCGNLITGRVYPTGTGTQNAAGAVGGYNGSSYLSCHENYGGATWSTATALPTTAGLMGSAGTMNSHLVAGNSNGAQSDNAYSWDGSSWSTLSTMNSNKYAPQGNGATANDAMIFGGENGGSPYGPEKNTEVWNGTSWSNDASMLIGGGLGYGGGSGATTSAGIAGPRYQAGVGYTSCTEEYNPGDCVFANLHCITRCLDATCTQI